MLPGDDSQTAWELPAGLRYEEWRKLGEGLKRLGTSAMWEAGRWLNYAEKEFPERDNFSAAKEITGFAENTLWNASYVCRRIDPSRRRRELSFGHHQVVANQNNAEQSRLLKKAVNEGWTVATLTDELRRRRTEITSLQPPDIAIGDDRQVGREHTKIQSLLLKFGHNMGYEVWVALNDRNRRLGGSTLAKLVPLVRNLPDLAGASKDAQKVIELIDVIWLRQDGSYAAAFEIEHTTVVYSGLLRMSDLLALTPNITLPLYLVAPDERLPKVMREMNRPTFMKLLMHKKCRMLTFEKLIEEVESLGDRTRFMDAPKYLQYISIDASP